MASVETPLIELVSARLDAPGVKASATLVAPRLAVTVSTVVANHNYVELRFGKSSDLFVPASVVARDPVADFAVLELSRPAGEPSSDLLSTSSANITWSCYSYGTYWRGGGVSKDVGHWYYKLLAADPPLNSFPDHVAGAPVFSGDRLVGIVEPRSGGDGLRAIPIAIMAASRHTALIADLLPLDDEGFFDSLSPSSRDALSLAHVLSKYRDQDRIHMEHLVLGLYGKKDGPTARLLDTAHLSYADLQAALARGTADFALPSLPPEKPPRVTILPAVSVHTREALVAARNIARTSGAPKVRSRHLLYGALSVEHCSVTKHLLARGLRKEGIDLTEPTDGGVTATANVPAGVSAGVIPPITTNVPHSARALAIAGYRSDEAAGEDLLDISKEVESLCMVLAAKDVEPPLSLGLFGDWGSGKSFFMAAMENWFRQLLLLSEEERAKSPYCSRIVQLKFNAWHYSDTNLWATLTSAILQGLADALGEKDDPDSHYKRARLQTLKAQAEEKLAAAQQAASASEAKVAAADAQLRELDADPPATVLARETLRAAMQTEPLKNDLDGAVRALGIPAAQAAAGELHAQLLDAKGVWDTLSLTFRHRRERRAFIYAGLALVMVFVAIPLLLVWASRDTVVQTIAGAATVLGAAAMALQRLLSPVRRALALVQDVRTRARQAMDAEKAKRAQAIQTERAAAADAATKARSEAASAREAIASVDQQLDELRADRRMLAFIKQRSQSTDYIAQLGTISHARRDFEQLSILLGQVKELAAGDGDGEPPLPRVDRIILYIDDLDRCPEDKVVDVLQAVHLLLAFKLFVVVVGVDPRWLLHSLRRHSTAFQAPTPNTKAASADSHGAHNAIDDRSHWASTPMNYLEKIFQIPFTLRPMAKPGFGRMVDYLAAPVAIAVVKDEAKMESAAETEIEAAAIAAPAVAATPGIAPSLAPLAAPAMTSVAPSLAPLVSSASGPFSVRTVVDSPPTVPPAPSVGHPHPPPFKTAPKIPMNPQSLRIDDREIAAMKEVHELIPSPRAAKRFVNVYRLLRTSIDEKDWKAFVGDGNRGLHRPVLVLLGILMGYPKQATAVLAAIIDGRMADEDEPVGRTLQQLLNAFVERHTTGDVAALQPLESRLAWSELSKKLARVAQAMPEDYSCEEIRTLAASVARFSFQSGRLLLSASGVERP